MKIKDIELEDLNKNDVFCYTNSNNTEITKMKLKVIEKNTGFYLIPGKIRINDGTVYTALLGISSDDSGEMFEAYFWIKNKLISQSDKNFLTLHNRKKEDIFPYTYHLNVKVKGDCNKT